MGSNKISSPKNNTAQIQYKAPKEVLGLISTMNELFLFEKKVIYN